MRSPIVRPPTLSGLMARPIIVVSFAALLSAASFQAALAQTAPNLLTAGSFAVLGASTVTNTGPTVVTGDLGVSPGTAITGFSTSGNVLVNVPPGTVTDGPGQVTGGSIHAGGSVAAQAHADASHAYVDSVGQACNMTFPPISDIGGLTLAPGVYCFPSSAGLTGTVTLNGGPDSVWIFNIGSTLITATDSSVVMSGGAKASNVFWAVGSSATLGTGTQFAGNILAVASITLNTNARVFGRALALNAAVTMDTNNVSAVCPSAPCEPPPSPPPPPLANAGLGAAAPFSVLGASTVTNTGGSIITGDLGVSPGTAITGFNLSSNRIAGPGTVTDGPGLVSGTIYAGSDTAFPQAGAAHADASTAYSDLVSRACNTTFPPIQEIGGLTLEPGVYCFPSSAGLTGTLTLNGGPGSVWVFKIGSTLTTAVNSSVVMSGGAADTGVFWAVGSSATLGTGTAFRGNILAVASITLTTGANVSGRALALNGAVTLDTNNVSVCGAASCLPAPSSRPVTSQIIADHYECNEAKPEDESLRLSLGIILDGQTVALAGPKMICAPVVVQKIGSTAPIPVRNMIDRLVCYGIEGRDGQNQNIVSVDNELFDPQRLSVKKPKMICVPSLQMLPSR